MQSNRNIQEFLCFAVTCTNFAHKGPTMRTVTPYEGIARECELTIKLTETEVAEVLRAYDFGIEHLSQTQRHLLDRVIAKLKDQIWP